MVNKDSIKYSNPLKREEYQRNRSREYMKKYRKENPEKVKSWEKNRKRYRDKDSMIKYLLWQKNRRHDFKNRIDAIKLKIGKCEICGYSEHTEILQFHHKDKNLKAFNLSIGNLGSHKWEIILEEIGKCQLICPNCHMLIHYNETRII